MSKKSKLLFLAGLFIFCCLVGVLYYFYHYQLKPAGEVCLNVFSGQPNPCWKISKNKVKKLTSMINSLPETDWKNFDKPALGYKGAHASIAIPTGLTTDLSPAFINAYQGIVEYNIDDGYMLDSYDYSGQKNPHLKYKKDEGRKVELWLLEIGKNKIDKEMYSLAKSAIKQ